MAALSQYQRRPINSRDCNEGFDDSRRNSSESVQVDIRASNSESFFDNRYLEDPVALSLGDQRFHTTGRLLRM
jgi:hypothetical protein